MTRRAVSSVVAAAVALVLATASVAAESDHGDDPVLDTKRVEALMPNAKVRSIAPVPMQGGLYEVIDQQGNVFYMDGGATIGFQCEVFDVATRRNLTQESLARLNAVDFKALPTELAIKRVKGSGKRQIAVFADPDCPFCTKLEQSLEGVDDVTVYTFIYPIESLHPGATARADRIWCATDQDAAWRAWVLEGRDVPATAGSCASPTAKIAAIASKFGVNGTPSLVFGSGRVVYGSVSREAIEGYLDEPALPTAPAQADNSGPTTGR